MKKLISILLALALCCMMIPAMAESDSMAGVWYIGRATINGEPVVVYDPEAVTVTLVEDGTGVLTVLSLNQQIECTWAYADSVLTLSAEGQEDLKLPVVDGEIELAQDPMVLYLTRTPDDTPVDIPGTLTAESADAFNGTYVPSKMIMMGLLVNAADAVSGTGSLANMKIEGEKVSFLYEGMDPDVKDFTFENGVLTNMEDLMVYKTTSTLSLLEDGSVLYTLLTEAAGMSYLTTIFYAPAE